MMFKIYNKITKVRSYAVFFEFLFLLVIIPTLKKNSLTRANIWYIFSFHVHEKGEKKNL